MSAFPQTVTGSTVTLTGATTYSTVTGSTFSASPVVSLLPISHSHIVDICATQTVTATGPDSTITVSLTITQVNTITKATTVTGE